VFVETLQGKQFRNYQQFSVTFSPGKNIILGNNGHGKTNLLEALYFLSHARSHRAASDRELIQFGEHFSTVSASVKFHQHSSESLISADIQVDNNRLKTRFKHHATVLKSRSEVLGLLPTVSFFLGDLLLLRGTPENRRFWLDAAVSQYDKRHLAYCMAFNKVRQQKSRLLKADFAPVSKDHLFVWNKQFAEAAAVLITSRLRYLALVQPAVIAHYGAISNAGEVLSLLYSSSVLKAFSALETAEIFSSLPGQAEIESALMQLLTERIEDEIKRGICLVGPHRDDIQFFLDGFSAEVYASQGQQRSVVLALKLSELGLLTSKLDEPPLLLLDDVMAELDADRQYLLVEHLHPGSQVILTTTHPSSSWQPFLQSGLQSALAITDADRARVFEVKKGIIQSELSCVAG
jgi:DNA replication and repair protein RecF